MRRFVRTATVASALGAAAMISPAVATAAPDTGSLGSNQCAQISAENQTNGWGNTAPDEQGQAGTYSATNVIDTDGSLELKTDAANKRKASYHSAGGVKLSDILGKPLTFESKGGNANWQIRSTGADTGEGNGFVTFVWSTSAEDAGQRNATTSDQWWATRDLGDNFPRGTRGTLQELSDAAGANTVVDDYGISSQPSSVPDTVYVDNVTFNGCTTNFAKTAPSTGFGSLENILPF
ncbi:hypothetical protein [Gordonia aquimaris]|uniref:Secreted protein n=1 Tax=Gordonia aquimaris TaxID=2984863 RepID=A0A9X3D710_9ACTN|nr:hypothetical protein [Gordonia aquimaris]MCX2964876.1 hypothetical protein [Gordonia aquimaris]